VTRVISTLNMLNRYETIDERLPRILSELRCQSTDILAAQEVLRDVDSPSRVHPPIETTLAEAGLSVAVLGTYVDGYPYGNAIFYREDKYSLVESGTVDYEHEPALRLQTPGAVYAVLQPVDGGPRVGVISAHFSWGAAMGGARLANARAVSSRGNLIAAEHEGALVFLAGDFNESPSGAAVQYLTGNSTAPAGDGAFWVDIWAWRRAGEDGFTQDPTGHYSTLTAAQVGIVATGNIPARRLDYIMVREWAYERLGADPAIELWGDRREAEVSDHFGISVRFGNSS
jgi:endonuclease/exonuclease/phosphatase family metal-dependent hydrolase